MVLCIDLSIFFKKETKKEWFEQYKYTHTCIHTYMYMHIPKQNKLLVK